MGISDFNIMRRDLNPDKDVSDANSLDTLGTLWPNDVDSSSEQPKEKFKCPSFKNYIFRPPPPNNIVDYFIIDIPSFSNCSILSSSQKNNYFIPAHDPPLWLESSTKKDKDHKGREPEKQIFEALTLNSISSSFPLYDFNGDFYLKIFILECYGILSLY